MKSCPTLCEPMDCNMPGFPVLHHLLEFAQIHVHCVNDAIPPFFFCCLLLFLPSILPSIRVFSNESDLHIRWPKYWSFSFNINEYSGLISFRTDWFDLLSLLPKGLSSVFSSTTIEKHQFSGTQSSLESNSHIHNDY